MSRLCVVGAGYVGLVTATCFADLGHEVTCLDIDSAKVAKLRHGVMPFFEPGLAEALLHVRNLGRIEFTTSYASAISSAEFVFIAVETPPGAEGEADLVAVRAAVCDLAPLIGQGAVVVNKSTVPIGTGDLVARLIAQFTDVQFSVVSNPEFLREGSAVADFRRPDRIVLGSKERAAAERVAELYGEVACPVVFTDIRTAEMIKYASNAFLATRISFINEIAAICEQLDADVKDVACGMGYDHRIGHRFLEAGIGWGGSCFPKDVRALIHMAETHGSHPQLLRSVVEINQDQPAVVVDKLRTLLGDLTGRTICLFGLSFKPNTDDMRNAPSLQLVRMLDSEGCRIRAYDPAAAERARQLVPHIELLGDPYDAAAGADGAVLVTEWEEFKGLQLGQLRETMRTPVLVDGRNLFDPDVVRAAGFVYAGIGRGRVDGAAATSSWLTGDVGAGAAVR